MPITNEKLMEIKDLVRKERKARINWVLAITQITFDELEAAANTLGFVIKGQYIATPDEAEKIKKYEEWKPTQTLTEVQKQKWDLKYCPYCGILLRGTEGKKRLEGNCSNCGVDFNELFSPTFKNTYFQKRCLSCGTMNPIKTQYCFNCGAKRFKRVVPSSDGSHYKQTKKMNPSKVLNIIALVITLLSSFTLIVWAVVEWSRGFPTISRAVVITLGVIGGVLLLIPIYQLHWMEQRYRYRYYKELFEDEE